MQQKYWSKAILTVAVILIIGIISSSPVFADKTVKINLSKDIKWVTSSDEYKLCVLQAYKNAMNRLKELAKNEKPGTWCVVLDADETVISNLPFQQRLQALGESYSGKRWNEWGLEAKATALPGAKEFCELAKELGGKVIIVTNRKAPLREPTMKNLDNLGIPYDACILREGPYRKDRSKVARRTDIKSGTIKGYWAKKKLPPLKIIMLAGDQAHDLYDKSKFKYEDMKDHVAKDFIIIPNPMYGSWEFHPSGKIKTIGSPENVPIEVKVGDDFQIMLDANKTTGYEWSLAKPLDKEVLTLVGKDYLIPRTPRMGAGGKSVWKFKAIGSGKALITLEYKRSWEKDKPAAQKRIYFVIVKEKKKK